MTLVSIKGEFDSSKPLIYSDVNSIGFMNDFYLVFVGESSIL